MTVYSPLINQSLNDTRQQARPLALSEKFPRTPPEIPNLTRGCDGISASLTLTRCYRTLRTLTFLRHFPSGQAYQVTQSQVKPTQIAALIRPATCPGQPFPATTFSILMRWDRELGLLRKPGKSLILHTQDSKEQFSFTQEAQQFPDNYTDSQARLESSTGYWGRGTLCYMVAHAPV